MTVGSAVAALAAESRPAELCRLGDRVVDPSDSPSTVSRSTGRSVVTRTATAPFAAWSAPYVVPSLRARPTSSRPASSAGPKLVAVRRERQPDVGVRAPAPVGDDGLRRPVQAYDAGSGHGLR